MPGASLSSSEALLRGTAESWPTSMLKSAAPRDLGCVRIRVTESTPRAVFEGRTYYFCSERCRVEFEQEPRKYLNGDPLSRAGS